MEHLVILASPESIPESMLQSLRLAGWKISMAEGIMPAKRLLQGGGIAAVIVELVDANPERVQILRFVQESCPTAMVIMLRPPGAATSDSVGSTPAKLLNGHSDAPDPSGKHLSLIQYHHLTPAQKRIAELVAQAYPNREIARILKIKEQSVRNQLTQVFKKMGILSRVELALLLRKGEQPV